MGYLFADGVLISNYNFKTKKTIMKKLFAIALIAVSFAACNSAETSTEEAAEATADSITSAVDSTADAAKESIDSTAAVADSTAEAAVDSLKK